ncbi:MAG: preprotein translocase subunit YajC [Mycobacteriaceae bacterium]
MALLIPLLVVFVGLMYLASRRQKKEANAVKAMQDSLQVDDAVMTTSGLHGTVVGLGEDTIEMEIAPGIITTWNRLAIRQQVSTADAEDTDDLEDSYDADAYEDGSYEDGSYEDGSHEDDSSAIYEGDPVDDRPENTSPRLTKD